MKRGGTATAVVHVSVLPGYHVNSDKPRDEFLIPLRLTWQNTGAVKTGVTVYPAAQEVQVGQDELSVFTGDFNLKTPLTAPANASTGPVNMTGKLHYQACNDRMCFRPVTVEVQMAVTVE